MADGADKDRQREFLAAIERIGKGRVILARCDNESAVTFGQSVGIKLFQGRHIEKLLSAGIRLRELLLNCHLSDTRLPTPVEKIRPPRTTTRE